MTFEWLSDCTPPEVTYSCFILFGCVNWSIFHHVKALWCYHEDRLAVVTVVISLWRVCVQARHAALSSALLMTQGYMWMCVWGWVLLSCHLHASEWDEAWHGAHSLSSGCQSQQALCWGSLQEASLWRGLLSVLFIVGWSAPWVEVAQAPTPPHPHWVTTAPGHELMGLLSSWHWMAGWSSFDAWWRCSRDYTINCNRDFTVHMDVWLVASWFTNSLTWCKMSKSYILKVTLGLFAWKMLTIIKLLAG